MSIKVDLPEGEWAEIRPSSKVPERARRPLRKAGFVYSRLLPETPHIEVTPAPESDGPSFAPLTEANLDLPVEEEKSRIPSDEEADALDNYNELLIEACVVSWSFPTEINTESIRNLDGDVYDALISAIADNNKTPEEEIPPT